MGLGCWEVSSRGGGLSDRNIGDEHRVRQFVLSALGFLNLTDVHRQEMGSEGL